MGKGGAIRWPSADNSSKQNSGSGEAVSLPSSLLVPGDMGMRKPHSLLALAGRGKPHSLLASAERGKPATMIGTEE